MGVLGDKLKSAIAEKKKIEAEARNDINTFEWKGPKKEVAGMRAQPVMKMVDMTPEQLKDAYQHCISMLFQDDKKNPGRYVLKKITEDQINKCTTELFLRYLENTYLKDDNRKPYPRANFAKDIRHSLDLNKEQYPREVWNTTNINIFIDGMPAEFRDVTVQNAVDAASGGGGVFDRSHITLTFITKLGVNFTPQELQELAVRDDKGIMRDRFDIVKENLGLKKNIILYRNPDGLTYHELRAMLNLRTKRYSDLTTDQLVVLKNKVLFRFTDELDYQINQWETRIKQLERVANELHNFSLLPAELNDQQSAE